MKKEVNEILIFALKWIIAPLAIAAILTLINVLAGIIALSLCFIWFVLIVYLYKDYASKDNPLDADDPTVYEGQRFYQQFQEKWKIIHQK